MAGFNVAAFYAKTGENDLFVPWGDGKVIIQQINASGRAEEDAYSLKLGYDFATIGAKGLSPYVFHGLYDTPDSWSNPARDGSSGNREPRTARGKGYPASPPAGSPAHYP
jgi:hypothetical protein